MDAIKEDLYRHGKEEEGELSQTYEVKRGTDSLIVRQEREDVVVNRLEGDLGLCVEAIQLEEGEGEVMQGLGQLSHQVLYCTVH